jgi:hypothetical protein
MTPPDAIVRAAAIELSAGVVLLERVAQLAEDFAHPGYKPDAGEREQMRQALERASAWREQHAQLLTWAKRTGGRAATKVIGVIP